MLFVLPSYKIICPFCCRGFHPRESLYRDLRDQTKAPDAELTAFLGVSADVQPLVDRRKLEVGFLTRALLRSRFLVPKLKDDSRRQYRRVCPHCHMTIPQAIGNDGFSSLIAVVGFSTSGKSCLIGEQISEMKSATNANFSFISLETFDVDNNCEIDSESLFLRRYGKTFDAKSRSKEAEDYRLSDGRIYYGIKLPDATLPDASKPDNRVPLIYRVMREKHVADICYFDKAGEELNGSTQARYADYLKNASAIIFVVDPQQYPQLNALTTPSASLVANNGLDPIRKVAEILSGEKKRIRVPSAVALSKSDLFDQQLGTRLEADVKLSHADPIEPREIKHNGGYNAKACDDVSHKIAALLEPTSLGASVKNCLVNSKYFAFSVFGKSPDSGASLKSGTAAKYYRLDQKGDELKDPIWRSRHVLDPLYWLLYEQGVLPTESGARKKTPFEIMRRKFRNFVVTTCLLFLILVAILAVTWHEVAGRLENDALYNEAVACRRNGAASDNLVNARDLMERITGRNLFFGFRFEGDKYDAERYAVSALESLERGALDEAKNKIDACLEKIDSYRASEGKKKEVRSDYEDVRNKVEKARAASDKLDDALSSFNEGAYENLPERTRQALVALEEVEKIQPTAETSSDVCSDRYCLGAKFCFLGLQAAFESQTYCQRAIYSVNYSDEYGKASERLNDAQKSMENAAKVYEELKKCCKENGQFLCFLDDEWKRDVELLRANLDAYRAYYDALVETKKLEDSESFEQAKLRLTEARAKLAELQNLEFPDFGRSGKFIEQARNNNAVFFEVQSKFLEAKEHKLNSHETLFGADFNLILERAPKELEDAIRLLAEINIPSFIESSTTQRAELNEEYSAFLKALSDAFIEAPELYAQVQENVAQGEYANCDGNLELATSYWIALKEFAPGVGEVGWFAATLEKFRLAREVIVPKLQESRAVSLTSLDSFKQGSQEDALTKLADASDAFNEAKKASEEIDENLKANGLTESSLQFGESALLEGQRLALDAFDQWLNRGDYVGGKTTLESAIDAITKSNGLSADARQGFEDFYRQTTSDLDAIINSPEEAETLYRQAVDAYVSVRFKDALNYIKKALEIAPENKKYRELNDKSDRLTTIEDRVEAARQDRRDEEWNRASETLKGALDALKNVATSDFFVKLQINDRYVRAELRANDALISTFETRDYDAAVEELDAALEELEATSESLEKTSSERDDGFKNDIDSTKKEIDLLRDAVRNGWDVSQNAFALNLSVETFNASNYVDAFDALTVFQDDLRNFDESFQFVKKYVKSWLGDAGDFADKLAGAREKTKEKRDAFAKSLETIKSVGASRGEKIALNLGGLLVDDNGVELSFVWNPAGDYVSGLPLSVDSKRQTKIRYVSLTKGFWMLDSETTKEAYAQVALETEKPTVEEARMPATTSWSESVAFCEALGDSFVERLEKLSEDKSDFPTLDGEFSLPTVAEWEYVAKSDGLEPYLTREQTSAISTFGETSANPVKQKSPNALGLFDMFGNCSEWVKDGESNVRSGAKVVDLTGEGSSPELKTCRGGSYADQLSLAAVYGLLETNDERIENVSFRFIYKPVQEPREIENDVYVDPTGATYVASKGENASYVTYDDKTERSLSGSTLYRDYLAQIAQTKTLKGKYYMATTPVTVGEYKRFIEATKYVTLAEQEPPYPVLQVSGLPLKDGSWRNPGFDLTEDWKEQPVVCVSFFDALRYVDWLNATYPLDGELSGYVYQLPTEDVWEYFARGDSPEPRVSWRNFVDQAFDYVKCLETCSATNNYGTSPVASFYPNAFGIFDALGDVKEWTTTLAAPNSLDRRTRVICGGSWASKLADCDLLKRAPLFPALSYADVGFRVCIGLPTPIEGDTNVPALNEVPVGQIVLSSTEERRNSIPSYEKKRVGDCLKKD